MSSPAETTRPLADATKVIPPRRRRRGWKRDVLASIGNAARELRVISDDEALYVVRQSRRRRRRPEFQSCAKG